MLMIPRTQSKGCVEHVLKGLARAPGVAPDQASVSDTMSDENDVEGYSKSYQTTHKTCVHAARAHDKRARKWSGGWDTRLARVLRWVSQDRATCAHRHQHH